MVAAKRKRIANFKDIRLQCATKLADRLGVIARGHARQRPWLGFDGRRDRQWQFANWTNRRAEQRRVVAVVDVILTRIVLTSVVLAGMLLLDMRGSLLRRWLAACVHDASLAWRKPGTKRSRRDGLSACIRYHGGTIVRDIAKAFMRVLVSNDDGVDAPGIRILAEGLREAGHEVLIVAPDRDRSGASNSLTLDMPVRVIQQDASTWRVFGTPTDCVHVAITGMLEAEPDLVVSGINNTANLGDDVIYSGTVAAAMEGRFLGLPALALSLASADHRGRHYETAARAAVEIIARLATDPLPADTILNVNVPDVAWDEVKGFEVTRLGNRHRAEPCVAQADPRGRTWWWIGAAGAAQDAGPGTDFHAVRSGHISITPIHVDLTRFQALEQVASWVSGLAASLDGPASGRPA
jgi:5'-nucleotidase